MLKPCKGETVEAKCFSNTVSCCASPIFGFRRLLLAGAKQRSERSSERAQGWPGLGEPTGGPVQAVWPDPAWWEGGGEGVSEVRCHVQAQTAAHYSKQALSKLFFAAM